ncbi:MAG: hypothetical protein QOD40_571 [Alphaproteobacteria bacterium]|jgi:hypothetical protein|nr:hypothetical protein [Alphaproteobacteria bacterium]
MTDHAGIAQHPEHPDTFRKAAGETPAPRSLNPPLRPLYVPTAPPVNALLTAGIIAAIVTVCLVAASVPIAITGASP